MQWYREAQALIEVCSPAEEARLLNGYAIALLHAARLHDAMHVARRAATCAEVSGLPWEHAYALCVQTWLAAVDGREAEAVMSAALVAQLCKHLNQPWMEAFSRLVGAFSHVYALRHEQAMLAMGEVAEIFDRARDFHMRMFAAIQVGLQQFLMGHLLVRVSVS